MCLACSICAGGPRANKKKKQNGSLIGHGPRYCPKMSKNAFCSWSARRAVLPRWPRRRRKGHGAARAGPCGRVRPRGPAPQLARARAGTCLLMRARPGSCGLMRARAGSCGLVRTRGAAVCGRWEVGASSRGGGLCATYLLGGRKSELCSYRIGGEGVRGVGLAQPAAEARLVPVPDTHADSGGWGCA